MSQPISMVTSTVYRATRCGESCHFGVASAARAWAGSSGSVEEITLHHGPTLRPIKSEGGTVESVKPEDHPGIAGGIVWSACERDWIDRYAQRCYNHGVAAGMTAGKALFGNGDAPVLDMAILIRRLAHRLEPPDKLRTQAIEFLKSHGLAGSPLRDHK